MQAGASKIEIQLKLFPWCTRLGQNKLQVKCEYVQGEKNNCCLGLELKLVLLKLGLINNGVDH